MPVFVILRHPLVDEVPPQGLPIRRQVIYLLHARVILLHPVVPLRCTVDGSQQRVVLLEVLVRVPHLAQRRLPDRAECQVSVQFRRQDLVDVRGFDAFP